MADVFSPEITRLIAVSRRALQFLDNEVKGNARNAQHDDILIGRELYEALAAVTHQQVIGVADAIEIAKKGGQS